MIISFTGTHGTGKTTLLQKMQKDQRFTRYKFYKQITRKLARQGFNINQKGDDLTQYNIMHSHYQNLFDEYKNKILDRCYLDGIVYTFYLYYKGVVSLQLLKMAFKQFKRHIDEYDIIFYLVPEFDIVEDGTRSIDLQFRNTIKYLFDKFINYYNIKVYTITGSIEQRYNQIIQILQEQI